MSRTALAALALALMAGPSLAAPEAAPAPAVDPTVMLLPVKSVLALRQYLGGRPYDETARLIAGIEACAQVQMSAEGAARPAGACPEVEAALQARKPAGPSEAAPKP